MESPCWSEAENALAACSQAELPLGFGVNLFYSQSRNDRYFYIQNRDDKIVCNVRLVSSDGGHVPVAAIDLARESCWFRAYLRNR